MLFIFALLASAITAVLATSVIIPGSAPGINYAPSNSWFPGLPTPPGTFEGGARFLLNNTDKGVVTYTFPHASTFLEFWGYQRSSGGMYSITVDNRAPQKIDIYNKSATKNDYPVRLYSFHHLPNTPHTIKITNLFDSRVGRYGLMNVDHFFIAAPTVVQPLFPTNSFLAESPIKSSYRATLSLGADATVNGGSGNKTVEVLLDAGATGAWVIWSGCTQSVCTNGHNVYHESKQHFTNLSVQDTLAYSTGGPANTLYTWRVNDTVSFGNVSILSTSFGAAYSIPAGGQPFDGNFGMARAYCGGVLCSSYPGFVETMYERGIIKAPVLSFYQLAAGDVVPSGLQSTVAIGGVDRNKYTGSIDWVPLTTDSMWIIPYGLRYVTHGGKATDATTKFTHPSLILDTGDPGLLGVPTNDWLTLVSLVGGTGPDSSGQYWFPCDATMTLNLHGSQNRNYTFSLVNSNIVNGSYCSSAANDAGPITNWIMGVPFLDQYYTVWYFGHRGIGSTLGFGKKNLGASAIKSTPVIGYA